MLERTCPHCDTRNGINQQFCGQCGSALPALRPLTLRKNVALTPKSKQIARIGGTVGLSLLTIAARMGLRWLQNRLVQEGKAAVFKPKQPAPKEEPTTAIVPAQPDGVQVTSWGMRVTEVWENGRLTRKTVERTVLQEKKGENTNFTN